jgi:hypothetical protein
LQSETQFINSKQSSTMHFSPQVFLFIASFWGPAVDAHGYLKSPRSRNYVAAEDGVGYGGTSSDPQKEFCPQCLNIGGTLAACGLLSNTNYDFPPNAVGGVMPANIQGTFPKGGEIDFDVVLTAHHKGHFNFYACPVVPGVAPTEECFKSHPLEFVQDMLYGAPKDSNYPSRAYIPPLTYEPTLIATDGTVPGAFYRYRMKLPEDIQGDLVLLQWHYLTANSCKHDGYDDYAFPWEWPNPGYAGLPDCGIIPSDGIGGPEQFWNCAEVAISSNGGGVTAPPTTPAPVPAPSASSATLAPYVAPSPTASMVTPTQSPVGDANGVVAGTCGDGNIGNGICPDSALCCSRFGHCGSTAAYCNDGPVATVAPVSTPTSAPVVVATQTAPPSVDSPANWTLSTESRCGVSELDARGNCGSVCVGSNDCDVGEWCWSVHANYCDNARPGFVICPDLSRATTTPRCGVDELNARERCGPTCGVDQDCADGEMCWGVHANTCDCTRDEGNGRNRNRNVRGLRHGNNV